MTDVADAPVVEARPLRQGPARRSWEFLRNCWRLLTSMRTALVLLFLLALAAVPGSILPQRGADPGRVESYFRSHPTLAPIFDRLSFFDVFAAPWFAAVYLLLFISLVGCVVPRLRLHLKALRSPPPPTPRNLDRMPQHVLLTVDRAPEDVLAAACGFLRERRFRLARPDGEASIAAEKGYLRESANLLFHLSLLALLFGVALGGLYGYKGSVLVTRGDGFANTRAAYDDFHPGRDFSNAQLAPLSLTLDDFHASFRSNGEPKEYDAQVTYRTAPGAPARHDDIRVNSPLGVDGVQVYLTGHGYAPRIVVRDARGAIVFDGFVKFLPRDGNYTSAGVVKVPDAKPRQLGFLGVFYPTAPPSTAVGTSLFPAARNPELVLTPYAGNLGLDAGAPQSVFVLDLAHLTKLQQQPLILKQGQTVALPGGGSVTFAGLSQYATFQVNHDPGKLWALLAAVCIVVGLIVTLRTRRRRVWVRARRSGSNSTVVEVAGLARNDAEGFADEFAVLVTDFREQIALRGGMT